MDVAITLLQCFFWAAAAAGAAKAAYDSYTALYRGGMGGPQKD